MPYAGSISTSARRSGNTASSPSSAPAMWTTRPSSGMVGKGLGISMMAEMMIRGKLAGVKTLPVRPCVSRELGMGLHPREQLPPGISRLRECVLEYIGEL